MNYYYFNRRIGCYALLYILCSFSIFLGCLGNYAKGNEEEKITQWNLSPDAQVLYNYLLLTEALSIEDNQLINQALLGLAEYDPTLPIFQDGVTILLSRKKYPEAQLLAEKGLKHFPNDSLITVLLSSAYSETGQTKKAISLLENFLRTSPESSDAFQELVHLCINAGENEKANKLINNYSNKDLPPAISFYKGQLLIKIGQKGRARVEFKKLVRQYPDFLEAWLELASLSESEKRIEEAIANYQRALLLSPDDDDLRGKIIRLQLKSKKKKDALATAKKGSSDSILRSAYIFADEELYDDANDLIIEAKKKGADPSQSAYFQSFILFTSNNEALKAIAPLDTIAKNDPVYLTAMQRKVQLLAIAKKKEEALQLAKQLRERFNDKKDTWIAEINILAWAENFSEAELLVEKALQKFPKDVEILYSLGVIEDERGKKKEALETMEKIVELNPKYVRALNYIGYSLAEENKDLDRALDLITTALNLSPDAEYIIDSLAWVYYRMEKYDLAWENIQKCLALAKEDPTVWEHYADIALAKNKKDEAKKGYSEALRLKTKRTDAIKQKLSKL